MLHYVFKGKLEEKGREHRRMSEWEREGEQKGIRGKEKKEENSLLSKLAPVIRTNNYLKYKRFLCVYTGATLSWILKLYI